MLTTHSKQKANEASSSPSSDAHTSPHVPVPRDHSIRRRVRRRSAAPQGQNVKRLTAPGRKGARQSHRPLPAARARGAGRGPCTHLGRRAAGGDPAEAGARPAVTASRQRAPRGRRAAARHGAHPAPGASERHSGRPRLTSEPACSHGATLGAPEASRCRRPPRLRRATRRLCRVSGGGGDARSHVSPRSGPQAPVPLALQASPASRAPAARVPSPSPPPPHRHGSPARSPPAAPPPPPPCPLDAGAASARTALGALGGGPAARRVLASLTEQSREEAARPGPAGSPWGRRSGAGRVRLGGRRVRLRREGHKHSYRRREG